jgi:hypothetical protein
MAFGLVGDLCLDPYSIEVGINLWDGVEGLADPPSAG